MNEQPREMTIAQALRRIKDIKGRVARHSSNAQQSVTHESSSPPAFDFATEWKTATELVDEMIDLQTRVAVANARTLVSWEGRQVPLAWCTKRLAEIKGAIAWHEALVVRAHEKTTDESYDWAPGAAGRVRIAKEFTCHLPEARRAEAVRALQDKFNDLNDQVEKTNHRTNV